MENGVKTPVFPLWPKVDHSEESANTEALPLILNIDYVNMQHNYVQKRLIHFIIHHNYVDLQHYYVDMRDSYVNMRLFIMLYGNIIMSHVDMNNSLVHF